MILRSGVICVVNLWILVLSYRAKLSAVICIINTANVNPDSLLPLPPFSLHFVASLVV